jgi:four helix bundle protein
MTLAHEKLHAYRLATRHLAFAIRVVRGLPRGTGFLADQYRRAALSIPLNIAEGVGRTGTDDQRRFFAEARGSAMECAAILDAAVLIEAVEEGKGREGKEMLEQVVRMLTVMCGRGMGGRANG